MALGQTPHACMHVAHTACSFVGKAAKELGETQQVLLGLMQI